MPKKTKAAAAAAVEKVESLDPMPVPRETPNAPAGALSATTVATVISLQGTVCLQLGFGLQLILCSHLIIVGAESPAHTLTHTHAHTHTHTSCLR